MTLGGMSSNWYYVNRGDPAETQRGPLAWEDLYARVQTGVLGADDLVWNPQLPEWVPAAQIPGLLPTSVAAPVAASPPITVAGPAAAQPLVARRRTSLLAWLIPLIAIIAVGAGLGAYFGFFYNRSDTDTSTTVVTSGSTTTIGSSGTTETGGTTAALGVAEAKAPDSAKLVTSANWGEVPANQIVVVLADGKTRKDADSLAQTLGGTVVGEIAFINTYQIETSGTTESDLQAAIDKAVAMPGVESAFADQQTHNDTEIWGVRQTPLTDPAYSGGRGKGFELIGAQKAWNYVQGSGLHIWDVHVGVVDTGVYKGSGEFNGEPNLTFPDRSAGELSAPLKDTNTDTGVTVDDPTGSHGTMVTGMIGADPSNGHNTGIASPVLGHHLTISVINHYGGQYGNSPEVAPNPNDPTQYVASDGKSYSFGSLVAITKQIDDGAKIINCSWGTNLDQLKEQSQLLKAGKITQAAYNAAYTSYQATAAVYKKFFKKMSAEHPDVLFVCSAGNDGLALDGTLRYPSGLDLPDMITVGNVMNDGTAATSSNKANTTPGKEFEVTLAAPGEEVVQGIDANGNPVTNTTDIGNGNKYGGGTSAAAPQVSAAAAILLSLNPNLTAAEIKDILEETARPGPAELGGKILAVDQAVLEVINQQRERQGLPAVTGEELEKAGGIDAVATTTDQPDVYSVRGILAAAPDGGTDIVFSGSPGVTIEGAEATQSLAAAGEVTWPTVTVSLVDPKNPPTITVTRKDNGSASVITLENIDINGHWEGTITFADVTVDTATASSADTQGCDLGMLDLLKGKTVPMTIDFTVDESGKGTATVLLDMATLNEGRTESEGQFVSQPFTTQVTYSGTSITFVMGEQSGVASSLSGTVARQGDGFVITGALTASGSGLSLTAPWTVTKQ